MYVLVLVLILDLERGLLSHLSLAGGRHSIKHHGSVLSGVSLDSKLVIELDIDNSHNSAVSQIFSLIIFISTCEG